MSGGFSYRGDLSDTDLPRVFEIVERAGESGVLEVTRGGMVKRVFIQGGYVVHASSSDPIDRLSEYIRRAGLVDEERIDEIDYERSNSSQRLGVLLVERGLLSPREVYDAICRQIEEIVWSLFAWQQGQAAFEVGEIRSEDMVQIKLSMRRMAFEGVKRAPEIEEVVARLEDERRLLEPAYRIEDLIDIGVTGEEMALLELVDGKQSLQQIDAESPFSSAETARRLHAFLVLGLVRAELRQPEATSDVSVHS